MRQKQRGEFIEADTADPKLPQVPIRPAPLASDPTFALRRAPVAHEACCVQARLLRRAAPSLYPLLAFHVAVRRFELHHVFGEAVHARYENEATRASACGDATF